MLYPREDKETTNPRNCDYTELAENPKVYRHELMTNIGETAGVVKIQETINVAKGQMKCPRCSNKRVVCVFQSQQRREPQYDFLFYVCLECEKYLELEL